MKKILILIYALYFILSTAFGLSIDDIYIEDKNKIISVQQAVAEKKGHIIQENGHYLLSADSYQKIFYLNNDISNLTSAMEFLFPNRIQIELEFTNFLPNSQIFFNDSPLPEGKIDTDGFADKIIYGKPGSHRVGVKSNTNYVEDKVNLDRSSKVSCKDYALMKCNVVSR